MLLGLHEREGCAVDGACYVQAGCAAQSSCNCVGGGDINCGAMTEPD